MKWCDVITHPCHNFKEVLAKPPLELRLQWVMTFYWKPCHGCNYLSPHYIVSVNRIAVVVKSPDPIAITTCSEISDEFLRSKFNVALRTDIGNTHTQMVMVSDFHIFAPKILTKKLSRFSLFNVCSVKFGIFGDNKVDIIIVLMSCFLARQDHGIDCAWCWW